MPIGSRYEYKCFYSRFHYFGYLVDISFYRKKKHYFPLQLNFGYLMDIYFCRRKTLISTTAEFIIRLQTE